MYISNISLKIVINSLTYLIFLVANKSEYVKMTNCQSHARPCTLTHKLYFPRNAIWATSWENLLLPYANNKGGDQPAHPRSLINAFIGRCLDSIIPLVSISESSSLYLAPVAAQAGLSLRGRKLSKKGFLVTRLIWALFYSIFISDMIEDRRAQVRQCT